MRLLLVLIVLLLVGIAGLGFYRGWFRLSTNSTNQRPSATITVDKDRIPRGRGTRPGKRWKALGQKAKEKTGDLTEKAK